MAFLYDDSVAFQGKPPARHYEHKETGAFISVPPMADGRRVLEHHLVTARVMLDEFGIADPEVFEARLQDANRPRKVI